MSNEIVSPSSITLDPREGAEVDPTEVLASLIRSAADRRRPRWYDPIDMADIGQLVVAPWPTHVQIYDCVLAIVTIASEG
jgi:hypothetical protein